MRIVCEKRSLHEAVQTVTRAVSSRSTLPILNNILFETRENEAVLSASDLEIGIRRKLPLLVEEAGSTTIPARLFNEVINNLPEAAVTVESDDRELILVACEKSEYHLHGLPADEFPIIPEISSAVSATLPQHLLRDMIRQTIFATSNDETRAILTGALLELEETTLRLVATDTHRLALRQGELPTSKSNDGSRGDPAGRPYRAVIIPARALHEVVRLLREDGETEVRIDIADNQVQFQIDETAIISRLIEGQFPNYERVIPSDHEKVLTIHTALFRDAVRRCAIVAREDANKIIFRSSGNQLILTADSQRVGRAQEEIPIELEGEPVEIAFNAQYLLDVLNVIEADQIRFELGGALNPGTIKPVGREDYVYVLMPMQIV
jgi:DNA polymerase-3 subunit beta